MKILLAIDASAASEAAVNHVASRPWPAGATVEVLSVVEPSHIVQVPELVETVKQRTEQMVVRAAEQLRRSGKEAAPMVLCGDPKSVIVDRAGHTSADFVVLGSHGYTGVTRFLLGGVASAVVRFSPCSVEVVRSPGAEKTSRLGMRVLLATDGSDFSVIAACSVAQRPWPAGTEIRILSVVDLVVPMLQPPDPLLPHSAAMEKLRSEAMRRAQGAIAAAEQILADAGLRTSTAVSVLLASPKSIIPDEAAHWGADLIVVGSHGRRGISRFMLGSVSEAVAAHAHCSVEVIR